MKFSRGATLLGLLFGGALFENLSAAEKPADAIDWQPWSDQVFKQAATQHRFVLLDLQAVWCHWCHVMDENTYADPKVIALIKKRYLAVRVDQDARPDLSNRYEDYGWPATVVFNSDGSEIVKRQGYIPPKPMASMLQAIIDDPSPGPSIVPDQELQPATSGALSPEQRTKLRDTLLENYDAKNRGWGTVHKFLDGDIAEYGLSEAARGDEHWTQMTRDTLEAARQLIDPVWGGVYQYSTDGDWEHPHFEKIMQMQTDYLRTYAQAYARWKNPADLRSVRQIADYLSNFLTSPDGAFYTSQDADVKPGEHAGEYFQLQDEKRREQGIPRIDQHIYARENGWAIRAFAEAYAATGEPAFLDKALRAAPWIIAQRALPNGGFRHDEKDAAGPYLGDSLAMSRAFLSLYAVTADRVWLARAGQSAHFVDTYFRGPIGYLTSTPTAGLKPKPQVDENVAVARLANLLDQYAGQSEFSPMAAHAMEFLAAPAIAEHRGFQVAGILLADRELGAPPLHFTIVGHKDDAAARALFVAALANPATYKRVEWWDRREGPLPNSDVQYPDLEKAAAFVCTDLSCSLPILAPAKLTAFSQTKL